MTILAIEVVGFVEIHGIDFSLFDEFHDLDRLRELDVGPVNVFISNFDVLALFVLVASRYLVPRNLDILGIAKSFVGDGAHILLMEVVERKLVAFSSAEKRNRNRHERKADVACPDSSHLPSLG
jgi:hypothetical protein